jgi:hypothetical protein
MDEQISALLSFDYDIAELCMIRTARCGPAIEPNPAAGFLVFFHRAVP